MKVITTNLLNRFWKNGVKPIKDDVVKKLNTANVINNLLATAAGYALDARQGKILDDKITELNGNYTHLTTNSNGNGFLKLPNGFKLIYGTYPAQALASDPGIGGYSTTISLTKYDLTTPIFAIATARYGGGFPKACIVNIGTDSIKIGCDVSISGCYIQWMAIG